MAILRIQDEKTGEWITIETIQGEPGKDGYTPQKGVDYFDGKDGVDGKDYVLTEEDKQEIVNLVLQALPNSEDVGY